MAATPGIEPMPPDQGREQLAEMLLQCCLSSLVELHARAPEFVVNAGERPTASPLARLQAANGRMDVANRRHRSANRVGWR